jgi:hypothetical protein
MATHECKVLVEMATDAGLPEFMRKRALLVKSPTPPIFKPEKRPKLDEEESKKLDCPPRILSKFEEAYRIGQGQQFQLEVRAEARPEGKFLWIQYILI